LVTIVVLIAVHAAHALGGPPNDNFLASQPLAGETGDTQACSAARGCRGIARADPVR